MFVVVTIRTAFTGFTKNLFHSVESIFFNLFFPHAILFLCGLDVSLWVGCFSVGWMFLCGLDVYL